MIIRLAGYKGPGRIFDKIVRWVTKSIYSHTELIFFPDKYSEVSFSADAWENKVRFAKFQYNPVNWDFVDIEITVDQYSDMYKAALSLEGHKYDYLGVLGFVIPFIKASKNRDFCSEADLWVLQNGGLFMGVNPSKVCPGLLMQFAKDRRL